MAEEYEVKRVFPDGAEITQKKSRLPHQSIRLYKGDDVVLDELCEMLGMGKSDVFRRALYMLYGAMKAVSRDKFIARESMPDKRVSAREPDPE